MTDKQLMHFRVLRNGGGQIFPREEAWRSVEDAMNVEPRTFSDREWPLHPFGDVPELIFPLHIEEGEILARAERYGVSYAKDEMPLFGGYEHPLDSARGIVNAFLIVVAGIAAAWLMYVCGVWR